MAQKKEEQPDELTIQFHKAIEIGEGQKKEIYSEMQLREPTLDELEQFTKNMPKLGEIGAAKHFIAAISGIPFPVVGKMGTRDFNAAMKYLSYFLDDSPQTGDT